MIYKKVFYKINKIIASWDPIGIGSSLSEDEYKNYILKIIEIGDNKEKLQNYLENLLVNIMGLDYDKKDETHVNDLSIILEKIIIVFREN